MERTFLDVIIFIIYEKFKKILKYLDKKIMYSLSESNSVNLQYLYTYDILTLVSLIYVYLIRFQF